jgi:polar amino acid transport system permease protein
VTPLLAAFDFDAFRNALEPDGQLLKAIWTTIYVSVIAQALGTLLGVFSALAGLSRFFVLRALSGLYVWLIRGTPVIVQIFFMYFGANVVFGFTLFPREVEFLGLTMGSAVLAGMTALIINEGAYMSEIVRGGILAIDTGQMEAATSIGMRKGPAMRRIVLPQAARVIVPGLGNEFNNMLKTSSLLSFIGVYELFQDAQVSYSQTFQSAETYAAVAIWYLLLTTIWTLVQVQIERYLGASDRPENETWYARWLGIRPRPAVYS